MLGSHSAAVTETNEANIMVTSAGVGKVGGAVRNVGGTRGSGSGSSHYSSPFLGEPDGWCVLLGAHKATWQKERRQT
jgi:hypothetical protein